MRGRSAWVLSLALAVACSPREELPATDTVPGRGQGASGTSSGPHGDHNPRHGGLVLMKGDLHFEVVPDVGGRHRVYFTDAMRADLPAAVAQTVSLTIHRPAEQDEVVPMRIDEAGESWESSGRPIQRPDAATIQVGFTLRNDQPYWIEVPFRPVSVPTKHP